MIQALAAANAPSTSAVQLIDRKRLIIIQGAQCALLVHRIVELIKITGVFFLARIAGEAQAIHFFNADLYVGSARCAPPLPRGCTGHVAHPFRSILWRPAGFARST